MAGQKRGKSEQRVPSDPEQATAQESSSLTSPTQADEFRSFLVALATDPAKLGAFIKDPDGAMQNAGISDVDRVILKSGQPWAIHARLSGQKFSFTPPSQVTPVTVLVVDITKSSGGVQAAVADQPTVRAQPSSTIPTQGSAAMFPNIPLQITPPQIYPQQIIHPQIYPQQIIHPQIYPQQIIHPQIYPQQIIHPQILPQLVIHPQIYPQQVIHPQILPQLVIHPQIYPQVIHPQLVIHPQIYPQQVIHPQILPQLVIHPQIYPQVIYPQIFPVIPGPAG